MEKKNIIILAECVILVIVSSILISKINCEDTEDLVIGNDSFNVFNISECEKGACNKEFRFNDNVLVVDKESSGKFDIKFNDYIVYTSLGTPYIGSQIFTFDSSIVFEIKDKNGNITLKEYTIGDFEALNVDLGDDLNLWYIKSVSVNGNTFTLNASRLVSKNSFMDVNNEVETDMKTCAHFKEFEDRDAEQTFTVEFTDGKFGIPTGSNTKQLKDLSEYSSLCNQ